MKSLPFYYLITPLLLFFVILSVYPLHVFAEEDDIAADIMEYGKVLSIEKNIINPDEKYPFAGQLLKVEITSGKYKGQIVEVYNIFSGNPTYDIKLKPNQRVVLAIDEEEGNLTTVGISDIARDFPMLILSIIFILTLIILGGIKGFKSLLSLLFTIISIFTVLLPLILKGFNPIVITVALSGLITTITLILVSGWKRKTLAAIMGIIGGAIISGLLAYIFGKAASLTGMSSHEAQMLGFFKDYELNFQGILFSAMLFGALGAVMDVGISIASSIEEVYNANPISSPTELFTAGMNVGRDIMGTMSNTLILAYTGSSLPLLLILTGYKPSLIKVINMDLIATEIIRALTGSLGLFITIPLTAAFSAWLIYCDTMKKYYC